MMDATTETARRRLPLGAWIAIGVAAVGVVVAGIALVIGLSTSSGPSASNIPVANLVDRPEVGTWEIENPFTDEVSEGAISDSALLESIHEVSTNEALVLWALSKELDDEGAYERQLALVDTKSGKTLWIRDWSGSVTVVSTVGSQDIVLKSARGLVSLNRSNGETISETEDSVDATDVGLYAAAPAGRIILAADDVINLYSTSDLTSPLWKTGIQAPGGISGFSKDRIFMHDTTYSIATGEELEWKGALGGEITYVPATEAWPITGSASELLRVEVDGKGGTLARVDPNDGSSIWEIAIPDNGTGFAFDADGVLVVNDGSLTKYSATDGTEVWSKAGYSSAVTLGVNAVRSLALSPVDFAVSEETSGLVALDPETGEKLYDVTGTKKSAFTSSNDKLASLLGTSTDVLYTASQDGLLYAYDIQTGLELWRIDAVFSNWYEFDFLGGNLVASTRGISVTAGDGEDFGRHPALLGIG